jgi:chitin disaccharide deacetylase
LTERFLIINADDFGLCSSVNEAIGQLYAQKRITSASMLASSSCAADAAAYALETGLPVGIHWTLYSEWQEEPFAGAASAEAVPSLLVRGLLPADGGRQAKKAQSGDVTRELDAQASSLMQRGIPIDHADSHGGTLYGTNGRLFFLNAFRMCRKYRLPFRFPRSGIFLKRQLGAEPSNAIRAAHRAVVTLADLYQVLLPDDMLTNPYPVKQIGSYEDLREYYLREIKELKSGVTELFLHPSMPDPKLYKRTPEWQKREWEYRLLVEPEFHELIKAESIRLISWKDAPLKGR